MIMRPPLALATLCLLACSPEQKPVRARLLIDVPGKPLAIMDFPNGAACVAAETSLEEQAQNEKATLHAYCIDVD